MRRITFLLATLLLLGACKEAKKASDRTTSPYQELADQYAEFPLTTDLSKLTEKEKQMLPLLIEAADQMEAIYWQTAYGDKEQLFEGITDSALIKYLSINYGPWDRLDANRPFLETAGPKPLGANFYPQDMTKSEFEALQDPRKTDWYSIVRRDEKGALKVIPYHEAYPEQIRKAASLLKQAAQLAEDEGLRNYLTLRSEALLTDDYLKSDLAWMDMKDNTLDIVIGPIETYEDALFGYKASHSGQILVKDKDWSKKLSLYAQYLPKLQENLPVPAAYKKEKAAYDVMGKERSKVEAPQMPKNRMFLISGNNTGTGILQNIMDANGTGLICETEADTISAAIGSEYGHWSDTLRKAFDHDRLSYNRRTDQEYREVKKSYLSVLLSGTPAQVKPLIPSTENGLFSRQLFYYMHGIWAWINQFESGEADLEAIFTDIGLEWKKQLDLMKTHGVHTLRLTDEQKQEFNTLFSDLFFRSGLANDNEMSSSIARLAVNTCRIMAEVAMIRALECDQPYQFKNSSIHLLTPDKEIATDNIKDGIITRWDVTITAEDFKAVLELVTPLYRHATHILSFLPSTEVKHRANADRDALFEAMGNQFTRAQLSEQATIMKIKPNTALSWLNRLIKKGLLINTDDKGVYTRTHVCVC